LMLVQGNGLELEAQQPVRRSKNHGLVPIVTKRSAAVLGARDCEGGASNAHGV
jgi:hypothetical protein